MWVGGVFGSGGSVVTCPGCWGREWCGRNAGTACGGAVDRVGDGDRHRAGYAAAGAVCAGAVSAGFDGEWRGCLAAVWRLWWRADECADRCGWHVHRERRSGGRLLRAGDGGGLCLAGCAAAGAGGGGRRCNRAAGGSAGGTCCGRQFEQRDGVDTAGRRDRRAHRVGGWQRGQRRQRECGIDGSGDAATAGLARLRSLEAERLRPRPTTAETFGSPAWRRGSTS